LQSKAAIGRTMRANARTRLTAFALGTLFGACCSADSTPGRPAGTAAAPEDDAAEAAPMTVETRADGPLTLDEPVTLRLAPPAELLEAVRGLGAGAGRPPTLRLTLLDLERPEAAEVVVRVFVNRPEASLATPIDAPGYVGDVGFFPTTASAVGADVMPESTFLLDLGPALAELPPGERLVDGRFIDVTLVVVPLRDVPGPEALGEVEIPFEGVRLSLHEPG
jgi:hypothetical protein